MVCSDEGFKHNHPAGVGGPLKQRVSQLGNVHVHLVGAMNQILKQKRFHTVKLQFLITGGCPVLSTAVWMRHFTAFYGLSEAPLFWPVAWDPNSSHLSADLDAYYANKHWIMFIRNPFPVYHFFLSDRPYVEPANRPTPAAVYCDKLETNNRCAN